MPNAREANRGASTPLTGGRAHQVAQPQARTPGEELKMATAAPTEGLPIFYNTIEPINLEQHGKMKVRGMTSMPADGQDPCGAGYGRRILAGPAPLPIVFSVGETPVPIALMGLNEGVNVFLDETGRPVDRQRLHSGVPAPLSVPAREAPPRHGRAIALLRSHVGRDRRVRRRRASVRRRSAERGDQGDPRVLRAVRSGGASHQRVHRGSGQVRPADGR